jgi:hypothetical protein
MPCRFSSILFSSFSGYMVLYPRRWQHAFLKNIFQTTGLMETTFLNKNVYVNFHEIGLTGQMDFTPLSMKVLRVQHQPVYGYIEG